MCAIDEHDGTLGPPRVAGEEPKSAADILPLVYHELHMLAEQRLRRLSPGQTLQPTALVNEVYIRLVGKQDPGWESQAHFFGAAATAMRHILVERAYRKATPKHGGDRRRVALEEEFTISDDAADDSEIIELHLALNKLKLKDPRKEQIVMLRFFAGLTIVQTARVLAVGEATVERDWAFAKAWLFRELRRQTPER